MDRRFNTPESFWQRVVRAGADECWEWQGGRDGKSYGRVGFERKASQPAQRVAWRLTYGPIPEGMVICHHCDNPPCCNPSHLFAGTQRDNIADRHAKGRTVNPPSRAKLTDAQVREVRRLYAGGLTQVEIASRFPVSRGNLSKIINRRLYAHVR
jgi:hypothetical protein